MFVLLFFELLLNTFIMLCLCCMNIIIILFFFSKFIYPVMQISTSVKIAKQTNFAWLFFIQRIFEQNLWNAADAQIYI